MEEQPSNSGMRAWTRSNSSMEAAFSKYSGEAKTRPNVTLAAASRARNPAAQACRPGSSQPPVQMSDTEKSLCMK